MVFNRLINCQLEFVKTKDTVLSALMYYVHVAQLKDLHTVVTCKSI